MSISTDSTKRALRTGFQALLGLLPVIAIVVPVLVDALPKDNGIALWVIGVATAIAGAAAVASKVINTLEERGVIPAWLKSDDAAPGKHAAPEN